jgi:hypothetical protein
MKYTTCRTGAAAMGVMMAQRPTRIAENARTILMYGIEDVITIAVASEGFRVQEAKNQDKKIFG